MRTRVIVNRRARHLEHEGPLLETLRAAPAGCLVVETGSLAELDAAVRDAAMDPPDAIVLAGGDGSYMAGVTAISVHFDGRPWPAIALAPGGTASTVARNWGYRGGGVASFGTRAASRYTGRLLARIAGNDVQRTNRPTLRVSSKDDTRIGFIWGAGLVSRFFGVYEAEGARGYRGAASIVARIFLGSMTGGALARDVLTPTPCAIVVDGSHAPFNQTSLICASVVRDLGLGMRLLYRAGESTERFHVVATPLEPRRLGPQLPLVLAGRPLLGPRVDTLARTVSVRFGGRSDGEDGAYVIDGELIRARAVEISSGPAITVLSI